MVQLRECRHLLFAFAALAIASYYVYMPLIPAFTGLFIFTLYFFRDPERGAPVGEGILLSPADGRVLDVEDVDDPYVGKARRASIFMSPFDVHVNRIPFDCTVKAIKHTPGKKVAAYLKGDLDARERNRIEVEGIYKAAVEQYAGVVARRIVSWAKEGQKLKRGERYGMIKFGSRVDLIVPYKVEIKVVKGDRVVAGETVVGAYYG